MLGSLFSGNHHIGVGASRHAWTQLSIVPCWFCPGSRINLRSARVGDACVPKVIDRKPPRRARTTE